MNGRIKNFTKDELIRLSQSFQEARKAMSKTKSLCLKCKFLIAEDLTRSCFTANSFIQFCHNHRIDAVIVSCKEFKDKEATEEPEVIPGHEFENDVMKLAQAEEQILAQTEAEAEEEMTKQAQEAEVQQEVKEKGGVL